MIGTDTPDEIRDFLTSRRARITPQQAGLPAYGGHRRVAGLRREEVALLAGVSVDYYTRLERGNMNGVSDNVLTALARALQLGEAERTHLFSLARAASAAPAARPPRRPARHQVRPRVQRILDLMTTTPAYVRNWRADILAINRLGKALLSPLFAGQDPTNGTQGPANTARFVFLDPRATDFFADWERVVNEVVATLRSEAGRDPYNRGLSDLVGQLSTRSEAFRTWWAAHNVRFHNTGVKHFHHPVVGDLTLSFETMQLSADAGLTMGRLHRRARLPIPRRAKPPGQLGGDPRPSQGSGRDRRTVTGSGRAPLADLAVSTPFGSGPYFVMITDPCQLTRSTRLRSRGKAARPYICRVIILKVTWNLPG